MHQSATKGWSPVHHVYYLVLVGLHTTHLELFGDVLANNMAGCKDVSMCCKRKLALYEKLLQL